MHWIKVEWLLSASEMTHEDERVCSRRWESWLSTGLALKLSSCRLTETSLWTALKVNERVLLTSQSGHIIFVMLCFSVNVCDWLRYLKLINFLEFDFWVECDVRSPFAECNCYIFFNSAFVMFRFARDVLMWSGSERGLI